MQKESRPQGKEAMEPPGPDRLIPTPVMHRRKGLQQAQQHANKVTLKLYKGCDYKPKGS